MTAHHPLTAKQIEHSLEQWLEVEFTFLHVDVLATELAALPRHDQDFLLAWIKRIATTNIQIAYQFARRSQRVLTHMDRHVIEAWALHAMDTYDRFGLHLAIKVIHDADNFEKFSHERAAGAAFEDIHGILLTFVRGLSGRQLKLEKGEAAYTDSETLFLPAVVARMQLAADNFQLCKAMVAFLWAQTRFGTFRVNLADDLSDYPDPERALRQFHALERIRLEACIGRELPGLFREIQRLKNEAGETQPLPGEWGNYAQTLSQPQASAKDSLRLLAQAYSGPELASVCYQGELRPDAVAACMGARLEKEKMLLRVRLAQLAEESKAQAMQEKADKPLFGIGETARGEMELILDGAPIPPPEDVRQLLTSIQLDLGEIPAEYLVPAGPGEYDPALLAKDKDQEDVWQGTYHEEGASLYPEWDFGRQHYRKNWCVLREKKITPGDSGFAARTLEKYSGLIKHLRRTFEAMRDEDRLLKRETSGDDVDIDALVEALANARDGSEMSDRLFLRRHRTERNIAVMFMVDMSGSTKGWINEAERESLVLLCEVLEVLGDRFAIYGFSGITRKRCEIFPVKTFDEPYNDQVQQRIAGIAPQEYTRMGVAIRHLSGLLKEVGAKTKLLITLSDGKPDDYHDGYRGQYGIEDTRMALIEAKRNGIHPFCITIDTEAREYLPHMYGPASYTVVDEVRKLPLKVADIYRKLTV